MQLVGDVAFYYLPYVRQILALKPDARFICLKRDRQATVDSYVVKAEQRNHWVQHDGSRWKLDKWDHCYPKYAACDLAEAIGRYWDDYYRRAAALESDFPLALRIFSMESLNSAAGQHAIFDFLGLPEDTRRVILGVRANPSRCAHPVSPLGRIFGLLGSNRAA